MSIYDGPGGSVKISRASVIAEAFPRVEHVAFGSTRESGKIGKPTEPLIVIGKNRRDLRLLEHEL